MRSAVLYRGVIEDKRNLTLQIPERFKKRFNVDVRIFNEVIEIDRERKIVKVYDKIKDLIYEESYDKLILSHGAEKATVKAHKEQASSNFLTSLSQLPA